MKCGCKDWIPTRINYEGFDWEGEPMVLEDVPAESCPLCGEVRVDADILSVYEQKKIGEIVDLTPEEMAIMWFLHAPGPRFTKPGYVEEKYRFNKMLFYLWARLNEKGFGEALTHDEFESKKRGPVPKHLKDYSRSLEEKGLVKMRWGGKKVARSYRWDLTKKGQKKADILWRKTPEVFRRNIMQVKEELLLIDTTQLMHKVHEEYPEYKAGYRYEDKE